MKEIGINKNFTILLLALIVLPVNVFSAALDWDVNTWPAPVGGVPTLTQTYTIGGGDVIVTIAGDTGALTTTATGTAASPQTNTRNTGGIVPAENSLLLRMDFPEGTPAVNEQEVTVTYTFTHPGGVNIPQFQVFDVDTSSSNQFTDVVIATGVLATGGNINPTSIVSGTANTNDGINTATGTGASGGTSGAGNVTFGFGQSGVSSFTFTYRNNAPNTAGSHLQAASIHDISFFVAPTVNKVFSPNVITSGDVSTLTLTLGNNEATQATLSSDLIDTFPAGVSVASPVNIGGTCPGTVNASAGGNTVTYASGSIIPVGNCTITIDVTSNSPGSYTNTIDIGDLQTNFGNNTVATSDNLTVNAIAAPALTKTFSPNPISVNGLSTLTIALSNTNTYAATLLSALVDTLPTAGNGDVVVAATPNIGGTCNSANVTAAPGATSITYASGATIPSGGCTITVDVTSATAGTHTNTIPVGALQTDLGNNPSAASDTLTVNLTSPPTVAKSFAPSTISAGGSSQLTITLGNINASAITLLANMDDNLPTGVTATSVDTVATTCVDASVDISNNARVRYISGASIPSGGCNIVVNVTSNTLGTVTNTIAAGALQTDVGSNASSASDNLTVNAGGGSASCPSGQTLSTASPNPSYASAQTNVGVTNPNNALGVYSGAGSAANSTNSANLRNNDILRLEFADTLAQNSSVILSLARDRNGGLVNIAFSDDGINEDVSVGTFGSGGSLGGGTVDVLTHLALTVPGDGFRFLIIRRISNRNWVDGASYDQICVTPPTADLSITKDDSSLTYTPGGTGTYTIVVTNNGPDDVIGATIADNLPNGVSMTAPWTCTPSSGSSSCNTAPSTTDPISIDVDIINGDSITVTVPVQFSSDMSDY